MAWRVGAIALLVACGGGGGGASKDVPVEVCGNEVDDDSNGLTDCADPACLSESCAEICGDALDNNVDGLTDCADPQCDGQGCAEVCDDGRDNDGDSVADCLDSECASQCDSDGDGFLNGQFGGDDCDDSDPLVHPGVEEVCDGVDNDCNGLTDQDDPDLDISTLIRFYLDNDTDGYGQAGSSVRECTAPLDYVENADDCNDNDPAINPAAIEVCDDQDNNCDRLIDDADPLLDPTTATTWYQDSDRDGLGDPLVTQDACRQPAGFVSNSDDCDDTNINILGVSMWVPDTDGDGYGDGVPVGPLGCTPPGPGYGPDNILDCNDTDDTIYPGAPEVCGDLVDSSCNGTDCDDFLEDFEAGSLGPDWVTWGNANWVVQPGVTHNGSAWAAANGNIGNNQSSHLAVTLDFALGGTITFYHSGDTETNYDFLRFYIDGVEQQVWSGNWAWTFAQYNVPAGIHELKWSYTKDGSVSIGADTVWVDDIEAIGGYP